MGCAASRSSDEDDDVVSLCRERKRLMKSAVELRYKLADAYCKYNQSLHAVALAIRLFVARHSSPSSPFLITFPSRSEPKNETLVSNPMYLQQRPSESKTHEAVPCKSPVNRVSSHSSNLEKENLEREEDDNEDEGGEVCEHFYGGEDPPMPSPEFDFGWDFFNPFDGVKTEVVNGFSQSSDDDLRAVREAEGIPELEEEDEERESSGERKAVMEDDGERKAVMEDDGDVGHEEEARTTVGDAKLSQGEHKGLKVIDTPTSGRELLEALKDVEDHFIRAYDSGVEISKMLETNVVHLQPDLEEIKESSSKLTQSITWRRSTSLRSSSCKSFLASASKSSSTWTEFESNLFDKYGGMESGSHSLTLGRLHAWEKKLYEEVKTGEQTRKIYEQKCSQLRIREAGREGNDSKDKIRAEVRDLHSRIMVAIRSAESISKRIHKLRDEELQPQLIELLHGLMRTWKIMLESHKTQNRTMFEVKIFTCPEYGKFCSDSHRLATLQLEAELQNWRACFAGFVSAQKAYVEVLNGWLSKFIIPEVEVCSKSRTSIPPFQINGPPMLVICRDWLSSLENLPFDSVMYSMKSFGKDIQVLWAQQGEEQQQKRKVDGLTKELDKRVLELKRAESKILESNFSERMTEADMRHRVEYLAERKSALEAFRKRLDTEKAKHHDTMQETQQITLNGFQTGFSSVFESLMEFSMASMMMYADLVGYYKNPKAGDENGVHTSIEGSGC
ncbi:protein ALTERED PHOSPHATE STARVATION RESPONSE 1-like [Cornus florida]|uniref:protein ALTERED PHOSPHATE STARVATION RESPONSE 1-like n=1 Tax=Cornus florida TaxID=4283 RepID=UPI00289F39C2|nr:protein ALTERED PHOSPHATE STARVATION RESPONSE 1-like [Cornus florida]